MSNVNYSLTNKGVRLVSSRDAWVIQKSGKKYLNPKYNFVGKMNTRMPNFICSTSEKKKPKYKGDVCNLNRTAKNQILDYFYDDDGNRNKRTVAYFGIAKKK